MEKTGWKTLAIISLILLICSIVSIVMIFNAGQEYELKRQTCAYDICGMREGDHDSYFYADLDDYCYCFIAGEMVDGAIVEYFLKNK